MFLLLAVKNLRHRDTTETCNGISVTHLGKGGDRSLHKVVRVGRALALGEDVLYTDGLEDGTHSTTSLHTGTRRSRLHEYFSAAELGDLLVRDGLVDDRNLDQILLGILNTLLDGSGNFVCLAETITYD